MIIHDGEVAAYRPRVQFDRDSLLAISISKPSAENNVARSVA
jgi:hypothetical protein